MNWTWTVRSADGGMNGLDFTRATTAGDFSRALIHAAPTHMQMEIRADDDRRIAAGDLERHGDYSPMTLVQLDGEHLVRTEVWPDQSFYGVPVLLAGGEVGLLDRWEQAGDRSWWRWSLELSNHTGRPADWCPDGQFVQR